MNGKQRDKSEENKVWEISVKDIWSPSIIKRKLTSDKIIPNELVGLNMKKYSNECNLNAITNK